MSTKNRRRRRGDAAAFAGLFATLGDATRLRLVKTLAGGEPRSIAELTAGSKLTRQAVTKHLRVLERVGMVRCQREGRESRFAFDPKPVAAMQEYLDRVSAEWDAALQRLKAFVEED